MSEHEYIKSPEASPVPDISSQRAIADASSVHSNNGAGSSDGDSDGSSCVSETSTLEYEHEAYSSYQDKVVELSKDLFPGRCSNDIEVERMEGGGYNRIIGLTLLASGHKLPWYSATRLRTILSACMRGKPAKVPEAKQYILRIPREEVHELSYQSITLSYLERQLAYPIPKSITYDSGVHNPLGQAYMLQKRLPGTPLHLLWDDLTHEQRKCAARCIAEVFRDLHKIKNTCAGVISLRNTVENLDTGFIKLEPFPISPRTESMTASDIFKTEIATPQTTRNFLLSTLSRQEKSMEELDIPQFPKIWAGFAAVVNRIYADGLVPNQDPFFLRHGDLYPSNLLFTTPTPSTVRLTGVIDWDSALFVPKFMSTRPPFYLWAGLDSDEEEENDAVLEPRDPEQREYKRIFEDVVGEQFYADSYRKEYLFLRKMWWFLLEGIRSSTDKFMAEQLLQVWEAEYPTFTVE